MCPPLSTLILFSLLLVFPFHTSPSPLISIPLSSNPSATVPTSLSSLAAASLRRARHLKQPHDPQNTPLFSHSYGGYSFTAAVGSPPQLLPLLLDSGSSLPWLPCTPSYLCRNCPSPKSTFIPKMSLSSKLVGCLNPKCSWIHPHPNCPKCPSPYYSNCTALCPPYFILYGSGSTAGLLLSETLSFVSGLAFPNFAVGCSLVSDSQPSGGVAGFGRGPVSVPSQLNLTRFSYCLVSRRYDDDANAAGSLILDAEKQDSTDGVSFTPFLKNPTINDVYSEYYYVGLNRITVGGKKVLKIPKELFLAGADGNGGVIIDSGTTFTFLEATAFAPLVNAFLEQVKYKRDAAAEERTGLKLCFELTGGGEEVSLPELAFHFKGGAEMRMPLQNYFTVVDELTASVCLTVVTDDGGGVGPSGPSVIIGNFQQQNYYMVYDLERNKLGFRKQETCIAGT